MQKAKLLLCLLAMLSASCANNGPAPMPETVTVDTACKWVHPILIAKDDKLSDGTARQILALNKAWQAACPESKP